MSTIEKLRIKLRQTKGIPALESTVNEILSVLYNDKHDDRKLVDLITRDVALTQKILKLVNSAMYAPFSKNVSTVSDALRVLGTKALIHLTLGALLITKVELADDDELGKTLLASELAKCISSNGVQENAAIAALLYNIGKLITCKFLPDEVKRVEKLIMEGKDPTLAEMEVLETTYQNIGVEVAKDWKLPIAIVGVLDGTGDQTLINFAKFSNIASSLIHEGRCEEVQEAAGPLNLNVEVLGKLDELVKAKQLTVKAKAVHEALKVKTDLTRITIPAKVEVEVKPLVVLEDKVSPEQGLTNLLNQVHAKTFANTAELASVVFKTFVQVLGAVHCIYFHQKTHYHYVAACGLGPNLQQISKSFTINVKEAPNVVHNAVSNKIDLMIADIAKLSAKSVPSCFKEVLPDTKRFIALPVIKDDSVKGIVYVDWNKASIFEPKESDLIKKIREEFVKYVP